MSKTQQEDARHRWYYESEVKDVEGRTSFSFIFFFFFTHNFPQYCSTPTAFSTARMSYWNKKSFLPKNLKVKYTSVGRWRRLDTIADENKFDEAMWKRFNMLGLDTTSNSSSSSKTKKWDWYYQDERSKIQGYVFFLISDFTLTSLQLS